MPDLGGPSWLVIDVIAVAILAAAIAYGMMSWRKRRSAAAESARATATHELYTKPDSQLPPSER
jgi:hypothetical protein